MVRQDGEGLAGRGRRLSALDGRDQHQLVAGMDGGIQRVQSAHVLPIEEGHKLLIERALGCPHQAGNFLLNFTLLILLFTLPVGAQITVSIT